MTQKYKNAMEYLVEREIDQQVKNESNPLKVISDINLVQVATFALNRLPPLYASSLEGLEKQKRRANHEFRHKITQAVSQGFAAVLRDPLKRATPLHSEEQHTLEDAKQTLTQLADIPQHELNWIVNFMESFLERIKNKQITEEEVVKLYYLLFYYGEE
jgi:hypothetical protein